MTSEEMLLIQGLIQVIWADGEFSEDERLMLGAVIARLELNEADLAQVAVWMNRPPTELEVEASGLAPEARNRVMALLLAMAATDGGPKESEQKLLDRLSQQLLITPEELAKLKSEIASAD